MPDIHKQGQKYNRCDVIDEIDNQRLRKSDVFVGGKEQRDNDADVSRLQSVKHQSSFCFFRYVAHFLLLLRIAPIFLHGNYNRERKMKRKGCVLVWILNQDFLKKKIPKVRNLWNVGR
jgi:hypothetical protein